MKVPGTAVVTSLFLLTSYLLSPPTCASALCPLPSALTAAPAPAAPVSALLDQYATSPQAATSSALAERSVAEIHRALTKDALPWIAAKGAADANRRRLMAATFALDVAGAELETQAGDVPQLVEWGCEQVRKRLPSAAELQWHVAALAVLEGLGNPQAVDTHLAHASARFPNAADWQHTRVWLSDVRTLHVHPRQPLTADKIVVPSALVAQYVSLDSAPGRAADARLRVGFLHFLAGDHPQAKASFARVGTTDDASADTRYLAHLFLAWIGERERQPAVVIEQLQQALVEAPHGRTASIWLATRYQLSSRSDDAQTIAARSLATSSTRTDPWRTFYGGDIARWPELIDAARKAAQ